MLIRLENVTLEKYEIRDWRGEGYLSVRKISTMFVGTWQVYRE